MVAAIALLFVVVPVHTIRVTETDEDNVTESTTRKSCCLKAHGESYLQMQLPYSFVAGIQSDREVLLVKHKLSMNTVCQQSYAESFTTLFESCKPMEQYPSAGTWCCNPRTSYGRFNGYQCGSSGCRRGLFQVFPQDMAYAAECPATTDRCDDVGTWEHIWTNFRYDTKWSDAIASRSHAINWAYTQSRLNPGLNFISKKHATYRHSLWQILLPEIKGIIGQEVREARCTLRTLIDEWKTIIGNRNVDLFKGKGSVSSPVVTNQVAIYANTLEDKLWEGDYLARMEPSEENACKAKSHQSGDPPSFLAQQSAIVAAGRHRFEGWSETCVKAAEGSRLVIDLPNIWKRTMAMDSFVDGWYSQPTQFTHRIRLEHDISRRVCRFSYYFSSTPDTQYPTSGWWDVPNAGEHVSEGRFKAMLGEASKEVACTDRIPSCDDEDTWIETVQYYASMWARIRAARTQMLRWNAQQDHFNRRFRYRYYEPDLPYVDTSKLDKILSKDLLKVVEKKRSEAWAALKKEAEAWASASEDTKMTRFRDDSDENGVQIKGMQYMQNGIRVPQWETKWGYWLLDGFPDTLMPSFYKKGAAGND